MYKYLSFWLNFRGVYENIIQYTLCHWNKKAVKHSFAWEKSKNATVITKKRNSHHIKKRTLAVKYRFYFFDIGTTKKMY